MVGSWIDREGRTLVSIVEHFVRPGVETLWLSELAELTGVAEPELERRLDQLAKGEFVTVDRRGQAIAGVVGVLTKGWQVSAGGSGDQRAEFEVCAGQLGHGCGVSRSGSTHTVALDGSVVDLRITPVVNEEWGVHAVLPRGTAPDLRLPVGSELTFPESRRVRRSA